MSSLLLHIHAFFFCRFWYAVAWDNTLKRYFCVVYCTESFLPFCAVNDLSIPLELFKSFGVSDFVITVWYQVSASEATMLCGRVKDQERQSRVSELKLEGV